LTASADPPDTCVQCRAKRRIKDTTDSSDEENAKVLLRNQRLLIYSVFQKSTDVYERLAYGKRSNVTRSVEETQEQEEMRKHGCTTGRLMTPRSAMDIPQTKSSMAKIAASRQLLWQRHKKALTEKLSAKRRQEQSLATLGNRRRSLPILAKQAIDPAAPVETNLEAIHEAHEEIVEADNASTKTHAGHFTTRSDGFALDLLDMTNDDEWRALTEEEDSLAQEEESLKKEIEETESISIDEELQKRVILDFSDVDMEGDSLRQPWRTVVDQWTMDNAEEDMRDIAETPKLVEPTTEFQRFRRPGEGAQVHQRLLSPQRKRYCKM
jgi:hypothetical protein